MRAAATRSPSAYTGLWRAKPRRTSKKPVQRRKRQIGRRFTWQPTLGAGPAAARNPMTPEYREHLAARLAAAALLPLEMARKHVAQVGIDPIPARRSHVSKMYRK
jgi:hypothetical protein